MCKEYGAHNVGYNRSESLRQMMSSTQNKPVQKQYSSLNITYNSVNGVVFDGGERTYSSPGWCCTRKSWPPAGLGMSALMPKLLTSKTEGIRHLLVVTGYSRYV